MTSSYDVIRKVNLYKKLTRRAHALVILLTQALHHSAHAAPQHDIILCPAQRSYGVIMTS